jgi:hypothetical protein
VEEAFWSAMAVVATSVLVFLGTRYTAQASKRAADYSAMLSAPDHISAGYDRLNDDLWKQVTDARSSEAAARTRYSAAVGYIRRLLALLAAHNVPPPEPPPELAEDVRTNGRKPT